MAKPTPSSKNDPKATKAAGKVTEGSKATVGGVTKGVSYGTKATKCNGYDVESVVPKIGK